MAQEDVLLVLQEYLSTYLSIKSVLMYVTTLQHVILIKWGSFSTQAKCLRTWFWRLQEVCRSGKRWLETKWFLMVLHLIIHINYFAVNVSFLLHLFFLYLLTQWAFCHSMVISELCNICIALVVVFFISHGDLIIFDFSVRVKSLFFGSFFP